MEELIQDLIVGREVVEALLSNGLLEQDETACWDYKEKFDVDVTKPAIREATAELVKDIAAFYNTHGGYLVFGIADPNRGKGGWIPVGIEPNEFPIARLRDLTNEVCGLNTIQIHYREFWVRVSEEAYLLGVLLIPKRPVGAPPVKMLTTIGRSGKNSGKSVFEKGDTFFRSGDSVRQAKDHEQFEFLQSDRRLCGNSGRKKLLDHNLPSQSLICPSFVGRVNILADLNGWLGDDFDQIHILGGEGGAW
tara:strand:+ start:4407 stop:5153 length:747 start_codon:yes stop_codon:yes gene_type:complete